MDSNNPVKNWFESSGSARKLTMQVFRNHLFTYDNNNKGIVVPFDKDPDADDTVLSNVEFVLGEKGPNHILDDKRLFRAIGNVIEEFDVPTEKFVDKTAILEKGYIDCFSQDVPNLIQAIGDKKIVVQDKRNRDEIIEDVIESDEKGIINYDLLRDVEDSDLIATVCHKNDYVLNVAWLLRNRNKRVLNRIQSVGFETLPFTILTDFQVMRHEKYVILTATGHKSASRVRVITPADKNNKESAFIAVMLYDISNASKPALLAKFRCVPPDGKKGSPDVNPSFPIRLWTDGKRKGFTIYAKWNSDKRLVCWTLDIESLISGKEVQGNHVHVDRSQGLHFDKTISIKASSMDPYSSAGFVSGEDGRRQVFTIKENEPVVKTWDAAEPVVETWDAAEMLEQEFNKVSINDKTLFGAARRLFGYQ